LIRLTGDRYRNQLLGRITVSLGIAVYPEAGQTPAELVEAADQTLYAAKNAGRPEQLFGANRSAIPEVVKVAAGRNLFGNFGAGEAGPSNVVPSGDPRPQDSVLTVFGVAWAASLRTRDRLPSPDSLIPPGA
jgi:hypothetical protein